MMRRMVRITNCVAGGLQHSTQDQETDSFSWSMVIFFRQVVSCFKSCHQAEDAHEWPFLRLDLGSTPALSNRLCVLCSVSRQSHQSIVSSTNRIDDISSLYKIMDRRERGGHLLQHDITLSCVLLFFFFPPPLVPSPSPLSLSRFTDQSLSQITFNGPIMNDDKAPRGPGPQNSFNHGENAQSNALKLLSCAIGSQLKLGYPPCKWQILIAQTILAHSWLWVCVQDLWSSQCSSQVLLFFFSSLLHIFSHRGCRDDNIRELVGQAHQSGAGQKYLSRYWMDCHEILWRQLMVMRG